MDGGVLVARERQMAQLDAFLSRALSGQGQVCFVSGEAGSGKTALISAFAQRAAEQCPDLIAAVGQGDAQTGTGDAYLPFREVLAQLTGDVGAGLAHGPIAAENASRMHALLRYSGQVLAEVGPDLIGIFVPAAGLLARLGTFVARKAGWLKRLEQRAGRPRGQQEAVPLEPAHIMEQYTNVLRTLAEKQPLLLLLDDLQWADAASIELLFRLGRRIADRRILLVGTYRPDEVSAGRGRERHPLDKVLVEIKRYRGNVWIDLGSTTEDEDRRFVDAFLDSEPNGLDEPFRQSLYSLTGGHPLFTIELLRHLQERGGLLQDERGRWVAASPLDWAALPARVEGVIEERMGRLEPELRRALTVASVEGEDFTAEVVARVQAAGPAALIQRLSEELDRRHRLIGAQGTRLLGSQRLSAYRFRHNLFQHYLYGTLDAVERSCLHEQVGTALEQLQGEHADEMAVQLARHFVQAGVAGKARHYLRRAGEQAAARFANAEAASYLTRALDMTPDGLPEERYALLLAREKVHDLLASREAQRQDLAALRALAHTLADEERCAEVALHQADFSEKTGEYQAAIAAAQEAVTLARASQAAGMGARGHLHWGTALWRQGDYAQARSQLEAALAAARAAQLPWVEGNCLRHLGNICYFQGNHDEARSHFEQALHIFRQIDDQRGQSASLNNLGVVCETKGDYDQAIACYGQSLQVKQQIGDRQGEAMVWNNLGVVASSQGDYTRARACYRQALLIKREVGDRQGGGDVAANLGVAALHQGDYTEAAACFEQALAIFREIGDQQSEAAVLTNQGLLAHLLGDAGAAQEHCQQALRISTSLGDRSAQGFALTGLGHALAAMGDSAQAAAAYEQALALRRELNQANLATEDLAGLARLALARDDLPQALAYVEPILQHLLRGTLGGTHEPFRVYLTCCRVLRAADDPRAREVLATAYRLLQEGAARIEDEGLRRSFRERVESHRDLLAEARRAGVAAGGD